VHGDYSNRTLKLLIWIKEHYNRQAISGWFHCTRTEQTASGSDPQRAKVTIRRSVSASDERHGFANEIYDKDALRKLNIDNVDMFDLTNFSKDSLYYNSANNNVIGKYKDETAGRPILDF
jgi:hypothetical protein